MIKFLIGLFIGTSFGMSVMCIFQVNRNDRHHANKG